MEAWRSFCHVCDMERLARITDAKSMAVDVAEGTDERFFRSIGFEPMDVEQADNGDWYVRGHIPVPSLQDGLEEEMDSLKAYLRDTDYMVVKCAELGLSMVDEYPQAHEGRSKARARINDIINLLRKEK